MDDLDWGANHGMDRPGDIQKAAASPCFMWSLKRKHPPMQQMPLKDFIKNTLVDMGGA